MSKLIDNPASRPEDLGRAMPESMHAVSVAMPLIDHVHAYEEGRAEVMQKLQTGYPRFMLHQEVAREFQRLLLKHGAEGESCICFPSENSAKRALSFSKADADKARLLKIQADIWAVFVPEQSFPGLKEYWQHTGEIISSRRLIEKIPGEQKVDLATKQVQSRIAAWFNGIDTEKVFISASGMASFFHALRLVTNDFKNSRVAQIGFPYVDSLKLMQKFCQHYQLFPKIGAPGNSDEDDYRALEGLCQRGELDAIFVELPTNATLAVADLVRLAKIARTYAIPLVVDDTIGSFLNTEISSHADIVVSSLTKYFSGMGDVMAGSMVLCSNSSKYHHLAKDFFDCPLSAADMLVLEQNSRTYESNLSQMQSSAQQVVEYLSNHPAIETVLYPGRGGRKNFDSFRRSGGGYGALFSIELKNAKKSTEPFYDKLNFCKGPSLGTVFTIVCPYTLLAHYHELQWAESCGVSRNLIRVSIGMEPVDELIRRFRIALE